MEQRISIFILGIILTCQLSQQALIVSSTEKAPLEDAEKEGKTNVPSTPQIYQLKIRSDIRNRFANTTVTSRVRNYASEAKQVVFSVVLPETGFISGFVMEVGGKNYTAYVKEKEEARRVYDEAVASGLGAAHVAKSTRDSNRFTVMVNVEAEVKAAFYLSYEQLLQRHDNHYEQVINIHPGQPVNDLSVEVVIAESRKISYLNAPPLRSGNEVGKEDEKLDPRAVIEIFNDTSAVVRFTPNVERQKELAHLFGTKEDEGLSGQFVIQYDVERDPQGGEVLIQDGYFVHFFAPTNLKPLPKLIVFVLDTSGSMWGDKLEQVKQAMANILEQLNDHDAFHLVEFNSNTRVWNLDNFEESVWHPNETGYTSKALRPEQMLQYRKFPTAYLANADNIQKAKMAVSKIKSDGSTSMFGALEVALHLVQQEREKANSRQPMILFLTDGEPTDYSTDEIMKNITEFNSGPRKSPIFPLSFGAGADKQFLQGLAVRNFGFSRHIYEAADASLQLQDFYRQISSPLLSGISFKYESSVTSLTKTEFPIHFGGSEIVVCGCYEEDVSLPVVDGCGVDGEKISLTPTVSRSISNVERIWAYLSISQLLIEKEYSEAKKEKALQLALKYSFVTSVSSLVVVKPNDTSAIDTEDASSPQYTPLQTNAALQYDYEDGDVLDSIVSYEKASIILPSNDADNPIPDLPWLTEVLSDGWLSAPNGTYKLGANETFSDKVPCPKSPLNEEGLCSLLHQCVDVHSLLKVPKDFFDHLCILQNEFGGICCPRK